MGKENGIASAEDFRKQAEGQAFEEPIRLMLPKCGLVVIVRRPRPVAFALYGGPLPTSLAAKVQNRPGRLTAEELQGIAKFWVEMFQRIFVEPGLSIHPDVTQISPALIPAEDQDFLIKWAVGEVGADGSDLASFRDREAGAAPIAGESGGPVEDDPKQFVDRTILPLPN